MAYGFMTSDRIYSDTFAELPVTADGSRAFCKDTGREYVSSNGSWAESATLAPQIYVADEPLIVASGALLIVQNPGLVWTDSLSPCVLFNKYSPVTDIIFWPATTTIFNTDPFTIPNGFLATISADPATVLWTDAPNCPQTINTLLIIGV